MGEVYRAEDLKLKRQVALKVLPGEMATSPERLERFQREAEAVAALNHPNIVTIHSVEHAEGIHFLTMELVDGESLDQTLQRGAPPLPRALEIAGSIADALAAAHERGIVHRDLKPANVMLTSDGRIKVLDFGLAKLAREPRVEPMGDRTAEMPTELKPLTEEGVVMGTAPYMSPEQAQGLPVDARSDIFSLGCMLYESVTGTRAFPGESSIDTLHKVIYDEPEPLAERIPQAPIQLQWILRKALAKDPRDRYQSAGDLAVDLRATRKDLTSDPHLVTLASGRVHPIEQPTSKPRSPAILGWGALLVIVAGFAWFVGRQSSGPETAPSAPLMSVRPITASGLVTAAAISPDGKYVAYIESSQGEQSLNLRQLGSPQSLQLLPPRQVAFWGLTFSPDSTDIILGEKSEENFSGAMFQISALGGAPRKLVETIDSAPSFSPDGSRFTFLRSAYPTPESSALIIVNADGSGERVLVTRTAPEELAPRFWVAPSWSPDGSLIAASVMSRQTQKGNIVVFDVDSGDVVWTSERSWNYVSRVDWLPEGDALLAIAEPDDRIEDQIWYVPYPEGPPHQITNDRFDYRITSLTADGGSLVTVPSDFESAIWASPADGSSPPRRISPTRQDGALGFDFTSDGRLVFQTIEAGTLDIAIMNLDGSERRLITDDHHDNRFPLVTADDRLLYSSRTSAGYELRLVNLDGTELRTLTTVANRFWAPALSPDGTWAVVTRAPSGVDKDTPGQTLWRVSLDSGELEQLTDFYSYIPALSPDGTRLAFYFVDGEQFRIGIMPVGGSELETTIDDVEPTYGGSRLRWTDDGAALIVNTMPSDRANLWRLPLDGGEPEQLTDYSDERLYYFDYTPDGETLVISRGVLSRDAVLIENFR